MASLTLTGGVEQFTWKIDGLSNPFNTTYYISAGVTRTNFTDGVNSISGIVSFKDATPSGSSQSTGTVSADYDAGTYTLYGFAKAKNGNYYKSGSGTVTVTAPTPETSYVRCTDVSITGKVTGMSTRYAYDRKINLDAYLYGTNTKVATSSVVTVSSGTGSTGNITINKLEPNTRYRIEGWCQLYPYGSSDYVQVGSFNRWTDEVYGSISYVSSTNTSITAKVTGLSTNSGKTRIVSLDAYYNGVKVQGANGSATVSSSSSSTGNIVIPSLSPGRTYTIKGYVSFDGGSTYHYFGTSKDITASTTGSSIARWDWDTANATANPNPATQAQTKDARDACRDKTAVSNFSWKVWNDLVYKVSEARVAGGNDSWNSYYATRGNTLMTSSDRTLTAVRYNSLRYNIGSVYAVPDSKKITEVSKGDNVEGTKHFLNFVTNYLNAYIDIL